MTGLAFVAAMARREARGQARRLWPFVAAVAVGVGALVAINSFTENLQDTVRDQARALLGADLAFASSRKFPARGEELVAELARAGGGAAQARVTSFDAMAYVPGRSGARLVQVAAVEEGYPFYGRIETDPPGEWDRLDEGRYALVDPSLLVAFEARVGDTLALGEGRFQIRGAVTSVPGDVGVRAAFGPRVFIPAAHLDETRLVGFGSRARFETFVKLQDTAQAQALADRYRPLLAVERVRVRTVSEDERSVRESMGRLGRYLGLVSLVAVLLGGLGVASAVHAFIKRRMETIAILRCLGASAGRVFAIYLVEAAAMGLAGSLAGAALGLAVQRLLPRLLGDFLPVDVTLAPSWSALASGLGVGAGVAVLFSLLPLLGVRDVSPLVLLRRSVDPPAGRRRDPWRFLVALVLASGVLALAVLQTGSLGVGAAFAGAIGLVLGALSLAAAGLARAVRRFVPGRWPYVWRQGLANLHRPANQTVAVILALGFGAFLLDTLFLVQHNLLRELRPGGSAAKPNLVLFDIQPDQRAAVEAAAREAGFTTSAAVPIVPMRILSVKGTAATTLLARAPAARDEPRREGPSPWTVRREYRSTYRDAATPSERIVAGGLWGKGEWREQPGGGPGQPTLPISMESGVAEDLGVGLGDEIVWDVQGLALATRVTSLRQVDWARFEPNFFVVFPEGPLQSAPQTFLTLARIDDVAARALFQRRIVESFPNVSAVDLSQIQKAVEGIVGRVALVIRFMALFSLAAGAAVLAGAVAASRQQRLREGALLKALGATRAQVLRVATAEYAALGALAAIAAAALAAAAAWAVVRFQFEASFALPAVPLLAMSLGVALLAIAVGLASSAEVFRRPSLEVLRWE
jgi:putative ABC transport system permease protein